MNQESCRGAQKSSVAPTKDFSPAVDIVFEETSGAYRIVVDLPGIDERDIEVRAHEGELEVSARSPETELEGDLLLYEAPLRSYRRRFRLAEDIDVDKISANLEAGVLTLELPRVVAAQPRKIEIRSAH